MSSFLNILGSNFEYIPCQKGLNVIVCEKFTEIFLDVYEISINGSKIIAEKVDAINADPVIKVTTAIEGKEYDTLFLLKVGKEQAIIVNEWSLSNGRKTFSAEKQLIEQTQLEEEIVLVPEPVIEATSVNEPTIVVDIERYKAEAVQAINENFADKRAKITDLKNGLIKVINEKLESINNDVSVKVSNITDEILSDVKVQLEQYKSSTDTVLVELNSIKENVEATLEGYITRTELTTQTTINSLNDLKQQVSYDIDCKIADLNITTESYKTEVDKVFADVKVLARISEETLTKVKDKSTEELNTLKESVVATLNESVANATTTVNTKLKELQSRSDKKLADISKLLEKKLTDITSETDKSLASLEVLKESVITSVSSIINNIENTIVEKTAKLNSIKEAAIVEIKAEGQNIAALAEQNKQEIDAIKNTIFESVSKRIKDIELIAPKKSDLDNLKKQLEKRIETESLNIKKYVSSYGGGGSVAVQYAAGGLINGNLTITGLVSSTSMISTSVSALHLSASDFHVDYIDFAQYTNSASVPYRPGRLFYEIEDDTLTLFTDNPDCSMQIGQEMWVKAVNKTNGPLANGTVVYLSGAQGNRPKMWPALAISDLTSADTIGVLTVDTANNAEGYVTTEGIVRGIDTRNFSEGATLYLSPTTPGGLTDVMPQAPQHLVKVGYALNSTVNGSIFVSVDNGYEINELHNVRITNPANGQTLIYNSVSALWVNGYLSGGGGGTSGDYLPLSGGTVNGNVTVIGTLSTTLLEATSANITYIDIKQYELSGFNVTGNVAISGTLSASDVIYSGANNSNQWTSTYTTVNTNSASWNYQGTDIKALTSNWESTYTTVQTNSSTTWNYQGTDIKSLTANWQNTYTNFSTQSANNLSVYSTVNTVSSTWLQSLSFNDSTTELSISNGNTIVLGALVNGKFLPLSGGSLTGVLSTNQDIEITDSTKGIILKSPNNFKYRVTVTDSGELVTTLV